ncbi:MAG: alpha/beta hydrolase [Microthrixaceae bacterium]
MSGSAGSSPRGRSGGSRRRGEDSAAAVASAAEDLVNPPRDNPAISPTIPEGVGGLRLPLGRRVHLPERGTTFVREVAGPSPEAHTVLLLHGWFASGGLNWYQAFEPLSRHFNVVAPDLRGHGRGIRNRRRFTLTSCADDVAALCHELGHGSVIACGYSLGGPVAQLLWRRHPDLVRGLVFCGTSSSFIPGVQQRLIFAASMAALAGTTRTAQVMRYVPATLRKGLPGPLQGNRRPTSLQVWAAQEMRRHDMRMTMEAGVAIATFNSRRWIHQVDVPTTVLITTKDHAVTPAAQLQLATDIPGASIRRYDEGHTSPVLESFGTAITDACLDVEAAITRRRRRSDRIDTHHPDDELP